MNRSEREKVVPIYTRKFLGGYSRLLDSERFNETVLFFAGVFLTVALPQIICTAYGGIIPFIAFAITASAGSVIGWAMYRRAPYRILSCVGTRDSPRAPSRMQPAGEEKAA